MTKKAITIKKNKNGIYRFIIDLPGEKVNILKTSLLREIKENLESLNQDDNLEFLLIESAKDGNFIAGADINEIKDITDQKQALEIVQEGQEIISLFASIKATTICIINGSCMGGGTELALACDYRLAILSEKTKMALPEVNLGIIPGFGGTQRLPRLIGLTRSLPLILTGKAVDSKKAFKIGLVDGYFPKQQQEEKIAAFIDQIIDNNFKIIQRRKASMPLYERLRILDFLIFKKAKANILAKTKGHYKAPLYALDVVQTSYRQNLADGLKLELRSFSELVVRQVSKNLIDLFFIGEKLKKDKVVSAKIAPKEIKNAAVLGAGIMGGGIAWLFTKINVSVRIKDISYQGIALGYKQVSKIYKALLKIRKYTPQQISLQQDLLSHSLDYTGYKEADIIVEAIIEDLQIKQDNFKELEKHIKKDAIIASNTSSLSISEMAKSLSKPERFIGMHFFNPVNRMPLIEVIPGEKTNKNTIATIVDLAKKTGKTPIVVKDSPGFLVNRILIPYINEAGYLLEQLQDIELIDKVISDFGMPMGPFTLADAVGIDVGYKVAKILEDSFGKRMKVSPLLKKIYQKKLLGKKTAKGFYLYEDKAAKINQEISSFYKGEKQIITEQEIINRLILVMVNEAAKCLEEEIVKDHEYLDMAMVMGTGFPAFRGGLLKYADLRGINNVVLALESMASTISKDRYKPANLLLKMAKKGEVFYK